VSEEDKFRLAPFFVFLESLFKEIIIPGEVKDELIAKEKYEVPFRPVP